MDVQSTSQRSKDQHAQRVEREARALIEAQCYFVGRCGQIAFHLEEDVLTIRGSVPTFYLKQLLQCTLKNLDGVRQIDNQVTVDSFNGSAVRSNR